MYEYTVSLSPIDEICSWNAYDYYGMREIVFYECVLKMDITPFKKGDLIPVIYYNYENPTIQLLINNKLYEYPITFLFKLGELTIKGTEPTIADQLGKAEESFYDYGNFFHENG